MGDLFIDSNLNFFLPYSAGIVPSNLFSYLQLRFPDVIFISVDDVRNEVDLFLNLRPANFLADSFEKQLKHWQKIIDLNSV